MDDVDIGNNGLGREKDVFFIGDDAFFNRCRYARFSYFKKVEGSVCRIMWRIEGRYVVALLGREGLQKAFLTARFALFFPFNNRISQKLYRFFRFAQAKKIDVISQWFCVVSAGTAGDDEGHIFPAVFGKHGNPCQIEHIKDVAEAHFILQRKADKIEIDDRRLCFQRIQGIALLTHERFHIGPRCIYPFSGYVVPFVEKRIKDAQAQMTHGYFIDIGETVGYSKLHISVILDDAVPFAAYIAGRFADLTQKDRIYNNSS